MYIHAHVGISGSMLDPLFKMAAEIPPKSEAHSCISANTRIISFIVVSADITSNKMPSVHALYFSLR